MSQLVSQGVFLYIYRLDIRSAYAVIKAHTYVTHTLGSTTIIREFTTILQQIIITPSHIHQAYINRPRIPTFSTIYLRCSGYNQLRTRHFSFKRAANAIR